VFKFAPYSRGLFGRLFREYEGYYSLLQFREWFRVKDNEGWISPNETVCDPDNFGCGKGSWLYFFEFFENEYGEVFISSIELTRN